MTTDKGLRIRQFVIGVALIFMATGSAAAQISTGIIEKHREDLQKQSTDQTMKRERGTQPEDWIFNLPDGVTTRQVTFYSDGSPCYGRIFFPKGFNIRSKLPR